MITQIQGVRINSLDELIISPGQFIDFMNSANDVVHPIGAIYTSTVQLVRYSFWLGEQKEILPKQEYKDLLSQLGWENEEKAYLKIKAAFNGFTPDELAQVEPRTIFLIALNFKKYQSVIPQMRALPQITQDAVRGFMKQCYKARPKKEDKEATIWRMMPDNLRACVIGPIYNQAAGMMLEEMVKAQGKSGESITEQAIIYFYNNEFKKSAEFINVASPNSTVTETVKVEAPTLEVVETAPIDIEGENNYKTSDTVVATAPVNKYDSWDAEHVVIEEDLNEEPLSNELDYDADDIQDNWSFELEENDDEIEDYEMLTTQEATSTHMVPHFESEENVVSSSPTPELAPVDQLIHTFQTAGTWQEICQALETYEEYKQEAWDALTRVERRRIIELTPPDIIKLTNAKREGLIMNFRVEREGVYHVQENGCFIWDIVFDYRLDDYLARLQRVAPVK